MALPQFSLSGLPWQVYNTPKNLVAQFGLDFTTYGSFAFSPKGAVQQTPNAGVQEASGVGVDNTGNMYPLTVSVGNLFSESVPAFTKTLIALGSSSPPVTITGSGGQAKATFYTGIYPGSIAQTNVLGATQQAIAVYLPPGMLMMYAGLAGNVPSGWLYCNGAAISRVNYPDLFKAIGTIYGAGDGASTFNLPDPRGQFMRGFDDGRGIDSGRALGSNQAPLSPPHYHRTSMGFDGSAFYGYRAGGTTQSPYGSEVISVGDGVNTGLQATTGNLRINYTDSVLNFTGSTDNRPQNMTTIYIIKT